MVFKNATNIDINFSIDVVTHKTASIILTTVVKFLSFHRNQIPFVFETFKLMIDKIEELHSEDWKNYHIERQRSLAKNTFDELKQLFKNITIECKIQDVHQALILFGATSFTPKEAFLINLPKITKMHLPKNHIKFDETVPRAISMSLLTSTELFDYQHCAQLNATNMFVFLNSNTTNGSLQKNDLFIKNEMFSMPKNCKTTIFNIRNNSINNFSNCCHDLIIFKDLRNLQINQTESVECNELKNDDAEMKTDEQNDDNYCWYESIVRVKGFKDVLVKGKSIWQN